uniref:BRISC and BRCA1-A complex member 2 n=1 Tax=Macaca mulatta TaxID=9544 RepID=A0A5F8AQP5_MACMU
MTSMPVDCELVTNKMLGEQVLMLCFYFLFKDVNEDPGEDVALLSVSFEDTEATQVYPKLYLSPRIEHSPSQRQSVMYACPSMNIQSALGGSSALHIPAFPGGGCLIDYVPQVCHLLTNKVQYVIQGYHKRREYIAAFLSHFGTGVVEYDAEGFTKLTLLLMWKDFCFLVHIDLPLFFPRDQPTLTFQSVYHFTNSGQLYSQAQKNYPYSPRWDGNEMAKRAKGCQGSRDACSPWEQVLAFAVAKTGCKLLQPQRNWPSSRGPPWRASEGERTAQ